MDLEEFYAADERRRKSAELEFGRDWYDDNGRWGVSWVEDTGEVYVMREPNAAVTGSGAGDLELVPMSDHALLVEVLAHIACIAIDMGKNAFFDPPLRTAMVASPEHFPREALLRQCGAHRSRWPPSSCRPGVELRRGPLRSRLERERLPGFGCPWNGRWAPEPD